MTATISPGPFGRPSAVFHQVQDEEKTTCYGGVPRCQIPTEGRHHSASGGHLSHNFLHFFLLRLLLLFNQGMSPPAGDNYSRPTSGIWDLLLRTLESVENSTTVVRFEIILSIQTLLPAASDITSGESLSLLARLNLFELQCLPTPTWYKKSQVYLFIYWQWCKLKLC